MGKNRTMDAKRVKYIRQSKARPRFLQMSRGQMKVGQSVDRSKIPQEYQGLFEYRIRAKGLIDPYLEVLFPGSTQSMDMREAYLAEIRKEKPEIEMCITLADGRIRKLWKYFNSRMNCIQFVEYHSIAKVWRVSITYGNDDRAMELLSRGELRWKETVRLGVEVDST